MFGVCGLCLSGDLLLAGDEEIAFGLFVSALVGLCL